MTIATVHNIETHPYTLNVIEGGMVCTTAFVDYPSAMSAVDFAMTRQHVQHVSLTNEMTGEDIFDSHD